jgi:hypothetical protein
MPNTHVFTGLDGTITVAPETGVEGDAAKAVNDTFQLAPIGRANGVTIEVESEMRPFHEIGKRYAAEIRPGNVNVRGTIGRAHINGALLKLMVGEEGANGAVPAGSFVSPTFNLTLLMTNTAFPGNSSTVTVHGVKLDGWSFSMPEDTFVMESVSFKALRVSVVDAASA